MFKRFIKNKKGIILGILILLVLGIWAGKGLFKFEYIFTHDGDYQVARSSVAIATLKEGGFPLRWAGGMNAKCGIPIFNFFYPLIYYLESFFSLFSKNIYLGQKIIMFASIVVSGIFFFLWAKVKTKKTLPSITGAILYLLVPYRFILVYVRGNPEYLSYALLPLVLYLFEKTIQTKSKIPSLLFAFAASLSGALLLTSHNIVAMLLMPILLLYLAICFIIEKIPLRNKLLVAASYIGSFGLSAFFVFPALLESKYLRLGNVMTINYKEQFPTLSQLIRSKWGYLFSNPGPNDGMSFMLGYAQWLLFGIVAIWLFIILLKYLRSRKVLEFLKKYAWELFFFVMTAVSIFLMLPQSTFVWEIVKPLQQLQFPWRLLGIGSFGASCLSIFFLSKLDKNRFGYLISFILIALAIIGNRNNIQAQFFDSGTAISLDQSLESSTTTVADEILDVKAVRACSGATPFIVKESGETINYKIDERLNLSGSARFFLPSSSGKVILGLEYFPQIYNFSINGTDRIQYADCEGRVCIDSGVFRDGENNITWKIGQTTVEKIFNWVTIVTFVSWILAIIYLSTKREKIVK